MAKLLIDNGADVNYRKTRPVLHQAVGGGHLEMAKLLISRGADINRDVSLMGTPLIKAMASRRNKNKYATVKLLVEHGANVNQRSKGEVFRMGKWDCRSTPLHAAVFSLDKDIVKFLIQKGADTLITDHKGKTPLQCAQDRYETIQTPAAKPEIQEIINILTPPKP